MRPDVRINEYYLTFISNAKKDIQVYQKELDYYEVLKKQQYDLINEYKDNYETLFKIYLEDEHVAIKRAKLIIGSEEDANRRFMLSLILKYGYTLAKIKEYTNMIRLANFRKNIPFRKYEAYVSAYYCKAHKFVLQGFGYKYNFGIGTLCINRWKTYEKAKPRIDYNATNKKRKELLALGKKLYNEVEAKWYAARNIPYDGIDYRVFIKESHIYAIEIVKSKLFKYHNHFFEHTEYVNRKFKGMTFKEMADICKDIDEISTFPVDLKYKLNILLYKDPSKYVCYIRNDEQDRYQYGAHNS